MFGIGFTELLLVLVVALLVLGPDKLPEVAKTVAKAYNELRRTGLDIKRTVTDTVSDLDLSGVVKDSVSSKDKKREESPDEDTEGGSASAEKAGKASGKVT